jgi:integrase
MSRRAGQIIKRGERKWLVRIYIGDHPETGKRIYRSKTIHGTKKDAERYLNSTLRDKDLGVLVEPANIALGEYLDRWLEDSVKPRVRPRTLEDYKRFLGDFVRPALGKHRLDRITPLHIQKLYKEIGEKVSTHAVVHTHRPLNAALQEAVNLRLLVLNPAKGVKVPKDEPKREMCALSAEQAAALQKKLAKRPRGFVYTFSLATGLRPGEVQALQWKDCDLKAGTIMVRRNLVHLKGSAWEFGEPKTKRSKRTIPLPASVTAELRTLRAKQAEQRLKVGDAYDDRDLVFAGKLGGPLDGQNLAYRVLKPALEDAKLPKQFRWYDCRHTCATLLLAAGENPKVVSERLGHATVAFTLDRYAHVLPGMQEAATAKLEAMLFGDG